ncbi:DHA2 family efflux MFS transporter permease subunit [Acidocella sp.]|uniref:DHA2 family efflux MFS transporter permease subunit n=1 Tax=Acidocella sp. TaxID=50710 RepID=UPI002612753A|nr:DHA2 family efflux MFS transporter permease subunit [Acidocella sp.]
MNEAEDLPVYSRTALVAIAVCTMLATLMQAIDSTIANVALPYMQGSMSASQDEIDWVLTSYIIAAAIFTSPTAFLVTRFGRTRVYVTSIIGFTMASILCGASQSVTEIVLCRLLQGAFGAALIPLSQTVLLELFPREKRGVAMSLWGIGVQVGPIAGPFVGGYLTENLSWRWVFYVNVPFGIIATLGLLLFLKETRREHVMRVDWLGFAALSLAVGALQLLIDRGETQDWFSSPEIVIEAVIAGVGFYIFVVQMLLARKPFLSPRLFMDTNFAIGTSMMFLVGLNSFASLALLSPYLQTLAGDPVMLTGFLLGPRGIGMMVAMLIAGQIMNRVDARLIVGVGFVTSVVAMVSFTRWTPDVSHSEVMINGVIQGMGNGLILMPLSTVIYTTLSADLRVEAASVFNLIRNMGSALGISVTSALLTSNTQVNHEIIGGAITPFNHALQAGPLSHFWNPHLASGAAALDAVITRQATIIAYSDDFKLMLLGTILVMPLALLLRTGKNTVTLTADEKANAMH